MFASLGDIVSEHRFIAEDSLKFGIPAIAIGWALQGLVVVAGNLRKIGTHVSPGASTVQRKWILPTLSLSAILLMLAFSLYRQEKDSIAFIDDLVGQNQEGNEWGLTELQLANHLSNAGAKVDFSASTWSVHYDGWFLHRSWKFLFVNRNRRVMFEPQQQPRSFIERLGRCLFIMQLV